LRRFLFKAGLIILIAGTSAWLYVREARKTDLKLNSAIAGISDSLSNGTKFIKKCKDNTLSFFSGLLGPGKENGSDSGGAKERAIELELKHGSIIKGRLIAENNEAFTIDDQGRVFEISKKDVKRSSYVTARDLEWPYKNNVVIRRNNTLVVDGEIIAVGNDALTVSFADGGGSLEMEVPKKEIDCLLFAPVTTADSAANEERLKRLFPAMKMCKEGNVTIFSDSNDAAIKYFAKAVRNMQTELYYAFFDVFRGRSEKGQNFIVIFDSQLSYLEQLMSIGINPFGTLGLFYPVDNTTYLFNAFGDYVEKLLYDVYIAKNGQKINAVADMYKASARKSGSDKDIVIDGLAGTIKNKLAEAYSLYKAETTRQTMMTLRHELTHSIAFNWNLQAIVISKPSFDHDGLVRKKEAFQNARDIEDKKKILLEILNLREKADSQTEILASQSWLAEGMATFCATEPMGGTDDIWLYLYQDAARKGELDTLDFLMGFEHGSFNGIAFKKRLTAYAESWALTCFLMSKYPREFMAYQRALADTKPTDEDKVEIFASCLNKDIQTIEKEFREYMGSYEQVDDPEVKRFMKYHRIFDDT